VSTLVIYHLYLGRSLKQEKPESIFFTGCLRTQYFLTMLYQSIPQITKFWEKIPQISLYHPFPLRSYFLSSHSYWRKPGETFNQERLFENSPHFSSIRFEMSQILMLNPNLTLTLTQKQTLTLNKP